MSNAHTCTGSPQRALPGHTPRRWPYRAARVWHVRGQLKVPEGKPHCCPAARPEKSKPCRQARPYLGEHGLPVLGDHHALVTVHRDGGAVVGLLRVSEDVVEVGHPSFKHSAEIARDEGPANSWKRHAEKQTINDDMR